jgi:hypothetical protein
MKQWDGFDEAKIGTASVWNGNERVEVLIYDGEKMAQQLIIRDGMTEDEAFDYIDFNIEGAYIGKDTPVIVWKEYL